MVTSVGRVRGVGTTARPTGHDTWQFNPPDERVAVEKREKSRVAFDVGIEHGQFAAALADRSSHSAAGRVDRSTGRVGRKGSAACSDARQSLNASPRSSALKPATKLSTRRRWPASRRSHSERGGGLLNNSTWIAAAGHRVGKPRYCFLDEKLRRSDGP